MGYAVEGTAAEGAAPVPAELPVSGGILIWHEIAAIGLIVVGVLSLATGAVGVFMSRRRAS